MTHWASEFYSNKTAIIVGGTSGIGLAIATAFHDAGAAVHATGATDGEVVAATAAADKISFQRLDIRDAAAVDVHAQSFGPVAALVDCAGVNLRAAEWTMAGFETAVDVNLTGAMRLALAFRPKLAGGAMLCMGSMFSYFGAPHAPAYTASKAGLVGLVKSLAVPWPAIRSASTRSRPTGSRPP